MHRTASGRWKVAALAATVALGVRGVPLRAAGRGGAASHDSHRAEIRELSGDFQNKPSLAPMWTIPVEALGFAAPGPLFLGERNSLVSLDFLGENELLFTFRVPALLRRTPGEDSDDEREIRARRGHCHQRVVAGIRTGGRQKLLLRNKVQPRHAIGFHRAQIALPARKKVQHHPPVDAAPLYGG